MAAVDSQSNVKILEVERCCWWYASMYVIAVLFLYPIKTRREQSSYHCCTGLFLQRVDHEVGVITAWG